MKLKVLRQEEFTFLFCLQKKTKEVLSLIVAHYQSLENDVRAQIQLEHDVEQEKIKKVRFQL